MHPALPDVVLAATIKALRWLHLLGENEESSRRGFSFCSWCFHRIAESQGLNKFGQPPILRPVRENSKLNHPQKSVDDPQDGNRTSFTQQHHRLSVQGQNEGSSNSQVAGC